MLYISLCSRGSVEGVSVRMLGFEPGSMDLHFWTHKRWNIVKWFFFYLCIWILFNGEIKITCPNVLTLTISFQWFGQKFLFIYYYFTWSNFMCANGFYFISIVKTICCKLFTLINAKLINWLHKFLVWKILSYYSYNGLLAKVRDILLIHSQLLVMLGWYW